MGLLQPLRRFLKKHHIYLLPFPSEDITPGTLLNGQREVLQHLADIPAFFGDGIHVSEPLESSALLDSWSHTVQIPNAGLKLGVPGVASVKAGLSMGREVKVEVGPLWQRQLVSGTINALGQNNYLTDLDYIRLVNNNRALPGMEEVVRLMSSRLSGLPTARKVDIVEATVYAEWMKFTFYEEGQVSLGVELEAAIQVDVEAGVEVEWTTEGSLLWKSQSQLPLGFTPVRYARKGKRFVSATF